MSLHLSMEGILLLAVTGFCVACYLAYRKSTTIPNNYLGVTAYTTISIPANGVGQISVPIEGVTRQVPACAIDGKAIPYRHDVIVEDFRNGVAYVRPWDAK